MNHPEMLRRFGQLLPQFEHANNPEGVLTKYARENNFAPAQLEKLGHIFNTAKTLHFLDKSAHRADTFKIVDVPSLLEDYKGFDPGEAPTKQASTAKVSNNPYAVPRIADEVWGRADSSKRAFVHTPTERSCDASSQVDEMFKAACAAIDDVRNADSARELLTEIKEEIFTNVRKLASFLDRDGLHVYPAAKAQVLKAFPEKGAKVCQLLEGHMEGIRHLSLEKTAATIPEKAFAKDPGGWFDVVAATEELMGYHKDAFNAAAFFKAATKTEEKPKKKTPKTDKDDLAPKEKGKRRPKSESGGALITQETIDPFYSKPKEEKEEDSKGESNGDGGKAFLAALQGITDRVGAGSEKVTGQVLSGAPVKSLANAVHGGRDKNRSSMDQALGEDRDTAILLRLLKDPIIRQADPKSVSDIYHVIRSANPQVAGDEQLAKLIVREAIQYGSVPSHVHKELVDTNKTQLQSEELAGNLDKQRYAIGGLGGKPQENKG